MIFRQRITSQEGRQARAQSVKRADREVVRQTGKGACRQGRGQADGQEGRQTRGQTTCRQSNNREGR